MRTLPPRLTAWQWRGVDALVIALIVLMTVLSVVWWQSGLIDVTLYHHYAQAFWQSAPPFTQFPAEYPPLALLPFSLTLLPLHDIFTAFGVGMAALAIVLYLGFARWSERWRGLACMGYLFLGEQALLMMRFDIVPALLTVAALWAARGRHFGWAALFLGLGTLTKFYPALLIPALLIAQWQWEADEHESHEAPRTRRTLAALARTVGIALGVIAVGVGVAVWRSPQSVMAPLMYNAHRPVQVESLLATLAWVGSLCGFPIGQVYSYGSVNWVGPLADALARSSTFLMGAGCALVYLWQWRGRVALPRAFLALICVILLANKVFSTQYLIWAAPLVAEAEGWDIGWLVVFALTLVDLVIYPYSIPGYTANDVINFVVVVAARNVALLAVTLRLLWRGGAAQSAALASSRAVTSSAERRTALAPSNSRT